MISVTWESPLGSLALSVEKGSLRRVGLLSSHDRSREERFVPSGRACLDIWMSFLAAYFGGRPMDLPWDRILWNGATRFEKRVYGSLCEVPFGATVSYSELAAEVGCRRGARAVGNALAKNPVPVFVPCHRVIRADGDIGGFGGGVGWKRRLLAHEAAFSGRDGRLLGTRPVLRASGEDA